MNRTVSSEGIDMLVEFEGEILKVYLDPVGLPTFGVGHLVKPHEKAEFPVGKKITRAVSREYLRRDLEEFEACVNELVKVPITQNQFDALVSLAFNIGQGNFKKSSVLRHLNQRRYTKAADAFRAWNKARENGRLVVLEGLTRRRNTERSVFLTPDPQEQDSAAVTQPSVDAQEPTGSPETNEQPPSQPPITTDPNITPPVQVTTGAGITNWLFSGGVFASAGASVWAWITSNANVVAIAVICVTVLILAVIFRKAILDAIRLQVGADPNKHNVT